MLCLGVGSVGTAAEHVESFDKPETALRLRFDRDRVKLLGHRRHRYEKHDGRASENVEFVVGKGGGRVWLEYELPPARVIDDLTVELWLRSNRPGAAVAVRVILPGNRDPETGGVLSTYVPGNVYEKAGPWSRLTVRTTEKAIKERVQLLRWKLSDREIDTDGMYVDRVVLQADVAPGTVEYFVDDLRFGPIVDPRGKAGTIQTISATEEVQSHVDFRLDHLYVDGRPFLPRFVPLHGDTPESLRSLGINTVLVPRYDDAKLLRSLREADLWAMATPPRPSSEDGRVLGAGAARLLPFGPEADRILLWHGGTRVKPERLKDVSTWVAQIRRADRLHRPMFVDVTGDEREFSRVVRTLGVTRHSLHGTFSPRNHLDWLLAKRNTAWPGTFLWTWVQTEPSPVHVGGRRAAGRLPVVVEPEQIRLQVYAALSAGCRGIGFWSRTPLDGDAPGDLERRLAIRELNLELDLLEPLLATAGRGGTVEFTVRQDADQLERRNVDFQAAGRGRRQRNALLRMWETEQRQSLESRAWEAAVLRTAAGTLILPVWYGSGAQCVPGPMAANDAEILIAGASETATAWEITPTTIRSLGRGTPGPGGRTFKLSKFDQTAAILVTTNRRAVAEIRQRIEAIAEASSRTTIDLAAAKLARVEATNRQLLELRVAQPDAPQLLAKSRVLVDRAEGVHRQGDYDAARQLARDAMQLLRILQRADWEDAIQNLASPVSSPHTLCHNTLPDHWRMVAAIGRSPFSAEDNLLRSGDFEDLDTMQVEGWWHSQNDSPGVRASAELHPTGKEGRYALRLTSTPRNRPEHGPPPLPDRSPVVVRTPPVPVRAGQLVHVGGWFRWYPEGPADPDGPVVYDDLLGSTAALRFSRVRGTQDSGWRRFEFVREVHRSRDMTVAFALNGFGELHLDDVRITPLEPRSPSRSNPTPPGPGYTNPLGLLNRLPSLPSIPSIPSIPGLGGERSEKEE